MTPEVVLISHASAAWPGARNLCVASDGRHLAITRNPVRDAARRLTEEGYDPASVLVIRDESDAHPEIRVSFKEALKA